LARGGVDAIRLQLQSDGAGREIDDPSTVAQPLGGSRIALKLPLRLTAICWSNSASSLSARRPGGNPARFHAVHAFGRQLPVPARLFMDFLVERMGKLSR
jgi:hypothetical protein